MDTWIWIIIGVVVVGFVLWYLMGRKKGPALPKEPPEGPAAPPPPPETPTM